jgi:hypothetical protein
MLPAAIAAGTLVGAGGEDVADNRRAAAAACLDQRGPIGDGRVDVVHHDGSGCGERFIDQLELAALSIASVPHLVLADVDVGCGESRSMEARLAGARQPDEDHELRHEGLGVLGTIASVHGRKELSAPPELPGNLAPPPGKP